MNILYVYADSEKEWNCSEWRCAVPNRAINAMSGEHSSNMLSMPAFAESRPEAIEKLNVADIVVIQRLALANIIPRMLEAQANGKVVIVDLDDAYSFMPKSVQAYKFWHEGVVTVEGPDGQPKEAKMQYPPAEQLEWGVKLSHGITTPSQRIAKDWEKFVDNTWLVPNYISAEHYLPFKKKKGKLTDMITIGWGGSHSHLDSWKKTNVIEALRKVCVADKRIHIMICGGDQDVMQLFRDAGNAFAGRVIESKWTPHNEWPRTLAGFDIGLIPLNGRYDARRSWIKSLEYTLMGIPWIGTKSPPTDELSEYGVQITNSVAAWERAINNMIRDYEGYLVRVDAGFEVAEQADVGAHADQLIEIYEEIYKSAKGQPSKTQNTPIVQSQDAPG